MSFIRLCDSYIDHPKFTALMDSSFRLWHEAMAFCRKHQTDGLIPKANMQQFHSYSLKRLGQLTTPWEAGQNPLLYVVGGFGFRVHDYLEWNLSKAAEGEKRAESKTRVKAWRASRNAVTTHVTNVYVPDMDRIGSDQDPDRIGKEAATFCDRFVELYREHRRGAHYHLKPSLDWQRVCDLLRTWDYARLELLAVILLTTDEQWISTTDRGIGVFVSKASWCDDRLREWEAANGLKVV